jgi:hypothetical protein
MRVELEAALDGLPEPYIRRVVLSVRNLLALQVKLEDPISQRKIGGTDVRRIRNETQGNWSWSYDEQGWFLEVRATRDRQDFHRVAELSVDKERRVIQLTLDPQAIRSLIATARSEPTNPYDDNAPMIISETDELHYADRPGPGLMAPQHEGLMQERGAMPGFAYGPAGRGWSHN